VDTGLRRHDEVGKTPMDQSLRRLVLFDALRALMLALFRAGTLRVTPRSE
jgi:hypothetical protein